jgi:hypothetical protein
MEAGGSGHITINSPSKIKNANRSKTRDRIMILLNGFAPDEPSLGT